jgi:hypothetical protein
MGRARRICKGHQAGAHGSGKHGGDQSERHIRLLSGLGWSTAEAMKRFPVAFSGGCD